MLTNIKVRHNLLEYMKKNVVSEEEHGNPFLNTALFLLE